MNFVFFEKYINSGFVYGFSWIIQFRSSCKIFEHVFFLNRDETTLVFITRALTNAMMNSFEFALSWLSLLVHDSVYTFSSREFNLYLFIVSIAFLWQSCLLRRRNDDVATMVLQARAHETGTAKRRHARRTVCVQTQRRQQCGLHRRPMLRVDLQRVLQVFLDFHTIRVTRVPCQNITQLAFVYGATLRLISIPFLLFSLIISR